jgi:hypothetical protein
MAMAGDTTAKPERQHVAVIFVHGIHGNVLDFAGKMERKLREQLADDLQPYLQFRSVFWADKVRGNQGDYYGAVQKTRSVRHRTLRKLVIETLGDAAAYQKTPNRQNSVYYAVHEKIGNAIGELDLPDHKDRPLILIGHSLGCHVISTFLYDLNKLKQSTKAEIRAEIADDELLAEWLGEWEKLRPGKASPFRRLDTLAGIVTMGNNMPLFTFTFGPKRVRPITVAPEIRRVADDPDAPKEREIHAAFPGAALPEPLRTNAQWLNFYSKRDLLGFPLKELYGHVARIHDIDVRSESPWLIPWVWCYFAHTRYWTNRIVLRDTARLIRNVVEAPAQASPLPAAG